MSKQNDITVDKSTNPVLFNGVIDENYRSSENDCIMDDQYKAQNLKISQSYEKKAGHMMNKIKINKSTSFNNISENERDVSVNSNLTKSNTKSNTISTAPQNTSTCTTQKYLCVTSLKHNEMFDNYSEVIINEFGLSTNTNKTKRFVFFGIDPQMNTSANNQCQVFLKWSNVNYTQPQALFYIFYDMKYCNYYWKSLNRNWFFSLVLQSYKQYPLDSNKKYAYKLGKIVVIIMCDITTKEVQIKLNKNDEHEFNENSFPITIGRINCSVVIKDESINKLTNHIFLYDNASTNGTQLLLNEGRMIMLNDDMKFNIAEDSFQVEVKDKN